LASTDFTCTRQSRGFYTDDSVVALTFVPRLGDGEAEASGFANENELGELSSLSIIEARWSYNRFFGHEGVPVSVASEWCKRKRGPQAALLSLTYSYIISLFISFCDTFPDFISVMD
jgi:hypothetical protein